ncbi:MAG TPA: PhzF family phenazine biosynthesis protein, partial [Blastocatellia bacterium]|nr:PhzF family phenazine biosynthesis protein [Blastocatellia bacterium]
RPRMRIFKYEIWDVFTDRPLTGNPLAVFTDAQTLSTEEMQALAREMNLSETTFIIRAEAAAGARKKATVRIFTPKEELPFAGHPVLGTAFALRSGSRLNEVTLDLKAGLIPVTFRDQGGPLEGEMVQPDPQFGMRHEPGLIAAMTGLSETDLDLSVPIETVSTGRAKMIVPLKSLEAIRRVQPRFAALSQYAKKTDGNSGPYFITRETVSQSARVHARNLIPAGEDPVTGSAGGGCAAWMVKHGWAPSGESVVIEQGLEMMRPGTMRVRATRTADGIRDVRVSGSAVRVGTGQIELPA